MDCVRPGDWVRVIEFFAGSFGYVNRGDWMSREMHLELGIIDHERRYLQGFAAFEHRSARVGWCAGWEKTETAGQRETRDLKPQG